MCAAHLHGVGQLTGQLVDVALDALGTAAVDSRDEGAADEDAVRAQCQCLEDVHAGADAAVHQDLDAGTLEGGGDLRQDFGGGGTLVEDAAAVVGYHDGGGTGLLGLQRALDGHDALDDEGTLGQLDELSQLGHALAAGRRGHILEEGQAGGIHVHCHGEAAAGLGLCHLLFNGVDVPGLDGRHAAAIGIADGCGGHGHDVGVGAVAGEGGDAALGAAAHQHVVVGHVGVDVGVVEVHRAHRAGEEGVLEAAAKQLHVGIGGAVLAEGIHVHTDVGPLIIIADGRVAHALCAGAGDLILAGHAVAHRAGLAVFADALAGIGQNL